MGRWCVPENRAHITGAVVRLTIVMISVLVAIGMLILESTAGRGRAFGPNPADLQASETGL
jgi:hypothetical protein